METLKSGDVPALVTNIEVQQILATRIDARRKAEGEAVGASSEDDAATTAHKKKLRRQQRDRRHRHRDWIEGRLLDYLRNSSCGDIDVSQMGELVSKLRSPVAAVDNADNGEGSSSQDVEMADDAAADGNTKDPDDSRGKAESGFGLTDGETLQILNHMPSEMVELHVMIEDLPSRMTEERQEELLGVIGKYAGRNDDDEEEGMEEEEQEKGRREEDGNKHGATSRVEPVVKSENGGNDADGEEEILGTISDGEEEILGTISD